MIRNVLVMKSGLVLFSREFANTVQQVSNRREHDIARFASLAPPHTRNTALLI